MPETNTPPSAEVTPLSVRENHLKLSMAELQERLRPFCEKHHIRRLEIFGSAGRGQARPGNDVDILVTPSPEATRHDLFIMAAEVEDALGRSVDFLIRSDVEAMKNVEARDLILKSGVAVYVP